MSWMVSVRDLSVQFGDFYAVQDVSFDVARGEIFGMLGANGAGKTTIIRVLCGLLLPSAGYVSVDDRRFVSGQENLIKQRVGYMSQRFTLYNDLSVRENFDFAAALHGLDSNMYLTQTLRRHQPAHQHSPAMQLKSPHWRCQWPTSILPP